MCTGRVAVHVPLIVPSCYCCYKPDDKPRMQKGPDCNYNKRKKRMKIPKVEYEAVNRRKTNNNIAPTKHATKRQTIIYKAQ